MLKIENTDVLGWDHVIRGMRNPLNSWDKSDSYWDYPEYPDRIILGSNDLSLMKKLRNAGSDHRKFMRMITVYCDITAPLYWWKEYDTYKVGTVANSCSTMHKITEKPFTVDDFSYENLDSMSRVVLATVITVLNENREQYLECTVSKYRTSEECEFAKKHFWWQLIQLLPSSYNQRRTVQLNYEVLHNIYHARRNHKLDEWHTLCAWISTLPYSELITGEGQ